MSQCLSPKFLPLKSPKRTTSLRCSNGDGTHNSDKVKFIRGKKLLKDLSSWAIGGPCNYFLSVSNHTQLLSALGYCRQHSIPHIVIGRGSNCLFDDLGFDGCVILNRIEFLERIGNGVYRVGSGFPFNRLGVQCSSEGFSGLEFAAGVPGTVGGAAFMNAGANAQETSDTIESIEIVTNGGEFETVVRSEVEFGYRWSPFQNMKDLGAIVAVTFRLQPSSCARGRQQQIMTRRRVSQPLGERSAGSVFRNPPNSNSGAAASAAELIDKAGLKGFRVGGAMVSHVHANFFVNVGGSTSQDMLDLIGFVKEEVDRQFGVRLKEEVLYVNPYPSFRQP